LGPAELSERCGAKAVGCGHSGNARIALFAAATGVLVTP